MKKIIIFSLFIIVFCFMILFSLNRKINQLNNIDNLQAIFQKVDKIVPKSNDIYYFSNIKDLSLESEIYYKTQFVLVPKIVTKKKYTDIPNNSYILILQDKNTDNTVLNIDKFFHGSDLLFSHNDNSFIITLLKKKE